VNKIHLIGDRFVEQGGDELLPVASDDTENNHSIFDREGVEVVDHNVIRGREKIGITVNTNVLVQNTLKKLWW